MSAQLFNRKIIFKVSSDNQEIDLSNLHIVFRTTALTANTPKTCAIRVYNLNDETTTFINKEGIQLTLEAGYEQVFGIIFSGQIIQRRTGRENGTDSFMDIYASDNDALFAKGFINTTIVAGSTSYSRFQSIAENVQVDGSKTPLTIGEYTTNGVNPQGAKLPRGRVYYGMAKNHLKNNASSVGAFWESENGIINVLGIDQVKQLPIPDVNYKTGLIGVPTQTIEGISFRALLNPNFVKGMMIHLNNYEILMKEIQTGAPGTGINEAAGTQGGISQLPTINDDGNYKILYVNHIGDTRGLDWYSDVVCYTPKTGNSAQATYGLPD